jgi:hypothetical protein
MERRPLPARTPRLPALRAREAAADLDVGIAVAGSAVR